MILTSESQLSAGNQILSAPGDDGNVFANPLDIAYSGGTASFNGPGGVMKLTQGVSWGGNFAFGDPLFFTNSTPGNLELLFSSDVTEVGTQFEPNFGGLFTASISAFDASNNLLGTYSADGVGAGTNDNSAVFLGFQNTMGDAAIRRVLFSTTNDNGGFSINQVSFGNNAAAAVPEPSTYAMFGLGILAIVALSRRKRKDSENGAVVFSGAAC